VRQVLSAAELVVVDQLPEVSFIAAASTGHGIRGWLAETLPAEDRLNARNGRSGLQGETTAAAPGFAQSGERLPAGEADAVKIETGRKSPAKKAVRGENDGEQRFSEPFGKTG
jgi:hypothetical protein